jgi:ketosteroid isomerase-like protein
MPAVAAEDANVAAIRAARDRYNAAIVARDVAGVRAVFVDDYKGIAGTNGDLVSGGEAMTGFFAQAFKTPGFITYIRTPDSIVTATPADRAMERGHWVGRSIVGGVGGTTEIRNEGEYLAVWVPVAGGWKLRSETFVTLSRSENPSRSENESRSESPAPK